MDTLVGSSGRRLSGRHIHGGIMKQETVSAYRPICTADALYGLVCVLDLELIAKILLSLFLIGLKKISC